MTNRDTFEIRANAVGVVLTLASPRLWAVQYRTMGNVWPDLACSYLGRYVDMCDAGDPAATCTAEPEARRLKALCDEWMPGAELPDELLATARAFLRAAGVPEPPGGWDEHDQDVTAEDVSRAAEEFARGKAR
jgi:hypothetical protein